MVKALVVMFTDFKVVFGLLLLMMPFRLETVWFQWSMRFCSMVTPSSEAFEIEVLS